MQYDNDHVIGLIWENLNVILVSKISSQQEIKVFDGAKLQRTNVYNRIDCVHDFYAISWFA